MHFRLAEDRDNSATSEREPRASPYAIQEEESRSLSRTRNRKMQVRLMQAIIRTIGGLLVR